jgi:hypothetical protein
VEFHHVGFADEAEPQGAERHASRGPHVTPGRARALVRLAVQMRALHGQAVVGPQLLHVDQRTLPLAEKQVLKREMGEKIVFGVHEWSLGYGTFQLRLGVVRKREVS